MSTDTLKRAGFTGKGRTLYRPVNDIVQLVNFQKSNFSTDEYINVAIWPLAMGQPTSLLEHKFPIRGRIEDIISSQSGSDSPLEALLVALDGPLSSLEGVRNARANGQLKNIYLSAEARSLLVENAA